jgi:hypothetical protein
VAQAASSSKNSETAHAFFISPLLFSCYCRSIPACSTMRL